jgi:adenosylcobinamide kinase/adenosylcobinamide-phosphate guanylyltransferase
MKTLILGGARSGKSRQAQQLAIESGLEVTYIATARDSDDPEMAARIQRHREERPAHWQLIEEPVSLARVLLEQAAPTRCVLVDCLTLWLSNLLLGDDPSVLQNEREALQTALPGLRGRVILVSNEVGLGIVPMGELSRRFVDEAGWLHQSLAAVCEQVLFVAAGLPLILKGPSPA